MKIRLLSTALIVALLAIFIASSSPAQAAVLVKYPTVVSTQAVSPENANDWVNPNNVKVDDAAYASITAATFDSPDISYRLKAQGFDFSAIPDGATIRGIIVEIERYCDAGETGADYRVQLLDASGALVGDNKAKAGNWPTTPTTQFYGGTEDGWNAGLTAAMVKDADFGIVLSVSATSANADIYVDYIRISVYYGTIDIGAAAIDRGASSSLTYTRILKDNPANAAGTIGTWEMWLATAGTGVEVATFFVVSGDNLSTRDYETIGNVAAGSKQTFTGLSTDCQIGDYAGVYGTAGTMDWDTGGGAGRWALTGDQIPCTNVAFAPTAVYIGSLYGTGTEAGAAITVSPTSYNFGVVTESSTPSTTTTYFTIDNNSTMQTDQSISVTTSTWSGGVTWTHSDTAEAGVNTAGLLANKGGSWGTGDVIVKYNATWNYIAENQTANTDYSFGLKLIAPTEFTDGVQKTIKVRITAVAG